MNVKRFNKKYMQRAQNIARNAPEYIAGYKVGAVIVGKWGNEYFGCNLKKTHPKQKKWSKSEQKICLHAEISAIISMLDFYADSDYAKAIYIWREGVSGNPLDALPCPVCAGALEYYGIDTIFHSGEYGDV